MTRNRSSPTRTREAGASSSSPSRDSSATTTAPFSSSGPSGTRRLSVLGIGLIIEEVGKGARLVFRYPASPPPSFLDRGYCHVDDGKSSGRGADHQCGAHSPKNAPSKSKRDLEPSSSDGSGHGGAASGSIDLFFDLPARVLSKLFRPKRPLCGQPLTLNVSGTTFCCRAELFDPQLGAEGAGRPLVLFSVIVALAPSARQEAPPCSENLPFDFECAPAADPAAPFLCHQRSDAAFHTIRHVHRNLARLCRVLTREELRCRYVSRQCAMLLQIRRDYKLSASQGGSSVAASGDMSGGNGAADVCMTKGDAGGGGGLSPKEKRPAAISPTPPPPPVATMAKDGKSLASGGSANDDDDDCSDQPTMTLAQRRDYVQNLIEIMLAASPPPCSADCPDGGSGCVQHGNLARELAHVFHWLSSPPTTQPLLSRVTAEEAVVYINRHVAVPLDPVDADLAHLDTLQQPSEMFKKLCVRPYHTILFPKSSPSEVLRGLADGANEALTSPSISHSLRRILPHVHPRKSLLEIAWDVGLPPSHVVDVAMWLVRSGICVVATPVLRKSRYACTEGVVRKMSLLALPFWQTFGPRSRGAAGAPHIFVVVSALTTKSGDDSTPPTLGEAIDSFSSTDAALNSSPSRCKQHTSDGFQYVDARHSLRPTGAASNGGLASSMAGGVPVVPPRSRLPSRGVSGPGSSSMFEPGSMEEITYSMAVWLVANGIIAQVKDFLVAAEIPQVSENEVSVRSASLPEEALYKELLQCGCLDGTSSVPAICFRFGLDLSRMERFIAWGRRLNRVGVVSRIASYADDIMIPQVKQMP